MKTPDATKSPQEMHEERLAMEAPFRKAYSKYLRNQQFENETWEVVLSEFPPGHQNGPPWDRRFILRNKETNQLFESKVSESDGFWCIQTPFEVEAKEVTIVVYEKAV